MSTTAVRMTHVHPHSASSAYVPRASRPSSPSLPPPPAHLPAPPNRPYSHGPAHHQPPRMHHRSVSVPGSPGLAPRMQDMERRGSSHLRHEVTDRPPRKEDISDGARAILKMLSSLPAPLPESLPATFLPSPNPTPSPPSYKSFSEYARSPRKRKASISSDEDAPAKDGLGLGISMNVKRQKPSSSPPLKQQPASATARSFAKALKSPELHRSVSTPSISGAAMDRSLTPVTTDRSTFSPAGIKKDLGRSSLRNEVAEGEDLGSWSKERFLEAGAALRARALLLKRHGDAYQRSPTAQPKFVQMLPADPLRGLLCLTDAVLLWLFAYWLEEQTSTRIRASPYNESQPLREFVRRGWENEMRKAEDEDQRERAKAMVGLMHLIEAVVCYHLNSEQLAHITRKTKELNNANISASSASGQGPSPPSSTGSPSATGPSPTAQSTHSNPASGSPESHTSQGVSELLPIITTSTSATHRAHTYLLTSRHHLSLRVLRTKFPHTFDIAIHSELADEALPAPGDPLGAAKRLDVDVPERFAWPIELGMHCPVAHTAVFGRCMVNEYGEVLGGWELKLS